MKYFFILFLLSLLASCTTREVEPTRQSRHTIDTTFQQKIIGLQGSMDKRCDSLFPIVYDQALDSISLVRKADMHMLVK